MTAIDALITSMEIEVKDGLIYILKHLDGLWPRTISTYKTRGAQIEVKNFAEAVSWFKESSFLDCRISAYPIYTNDYISRTGIAPTVLLVDIDEEHFKTSEEFESAAARTYTNFYSMLGSRPTQLATGGGKHFLIRQQVDVFEKSDTFRKFDQPSRRFMQFEEQLLTDGKGDRSHWSTVSFNNCMLRIPGSINSKLIKLDDKGRIIDIPRVRIEKRWDENTPIIGRLVLMQYYNWLQFAAIREIRKQKARERKYIYGQVKDKINLHDYGYIDKLFDKPIGDFRKYCIWRIFVPYFVNVKGLSILETFNKVKSWLDGCNSISRLDFNSKQKIDYAVGHVGKFTPIRKYQLKEDNPKLYIQLEKEGVISS